MKLNIFSIAFALLGPILMFAQVKVGSNPDTIDSSSIMELESSDKALVITRLSNAEMNSINPLNGAIIYNMDTLCVHYYNGTEWINLCDVSNVAGFSFTDNGDGTITLEDGHGDQIIFNGAPETITTLVDNLDGTYTYTNESGDATIISDTVTTFAQDNGTGVITYTNESAIDQTANVVSTDANNEITVGSDGGAFYESPIKAFGKIAADGSIIRVYPNTITIDKLINPNPTINGEYRVNLPNGLVNDANYIIQLTQPSRQGVGNDDPNIAYLNQTITSFEVTIGDNDNGGTDRDRFDSNFMFIVLDLNP